MRGCFTGTVRYGTVRYGTALVHIRASIMHTEYCGDFVQYSGSTAQDVGSPLLILNSLDLM